MISKNKLLMYLKKKETKDARFVRINVFSSSKKQIKLVQKQQQEILFFSVFIYIFLFKKRVSKLLLLH